jgi:5'-nucleotidase
MIMDIIIDVDDVLADLLPVWLGFYNRDYDDDLTPDDITEWDLTGFVKPECGKKVYHYLRHPDLYKHVEPVQGALEGIQVLASRGHRLLLVTAQDHPGKRTWLNENYFYSFAEEDGLIVARDKNLIKADVIVDDRPETVAAFSGLGILFTRAHNEHSDWSPRADNWYDVVRFIDEYDAGHSSTAIPGVGRDVMVDVNDAGGKQSKLDYRFDLIDPLALFRIANILYDGANKYGEENWRKIALKDNLNHALMHIFAYLAGDAQDQHLSHAFCRLMFALSQELRGVG